MSNIQLPAVIHSTSTLLEQLTQALGAPRSILASDEEIAHAWANLPRELSRIPPDRINELLARMCVAVATGLFDSAINYAWNTAVLELRRRVREFGLHVIPQIIGRAFDEKALIELKDAELLDLCVSLNLITEDGFFFLSQCREVRNNFSAAHPPMGALDDREFILFLSRCVKYALAATSNPKGIDVHVFLATVKGGRFSESQKQVWIDRIAETHDAQQEMVFGTLHGIYCDPASAEEARLNALDIMRGFAQELSPKVRAILVDRHNDYLARGEMQRHIASRRFLESLGLLGVLSDPERHAIISNACKKLLSVHHALDNFYNEPPFAERLLEISLQGPIPESIQSEYVEAVVTCAVGNPYGYSWEAAPHYEKMIKSFTPKEIRAMLMSPQGNSMVASRIRTYSGCQKRFKCLVTLLDPQSVSAELKKAYEFWL